MQRFGQVVTQIEYVILNAVKDLPRQTVRCFATLSMTYYF